MCVRTVVTEAGDVGAVLAGPDGEWAGSRRCMGLEVLAVAARRHPSRAGLERGIGKADPTLLLALAG